MMANDPDDYRDDFEAEEEAEDEEEIEGDVDQGNLLKGIDNKTVKNYGFRRLHPLFKYNLFSLKHFL